MPRIYLDHHTATRPDPASVAALLPFLKDHWGSTAAPHQMGQELFPHVEESTQQIVKSLGATTEDPFYFFSSSAEAMNYLYQAHYFEGIRQTGKNHIVTSNSEEAPILMPLRRLEELSCSTQIVSVNAQGQLTKELLAQKLSPRTSLVSISWANGLSGVIHPIADLAEVCRDKGVQLHVDASYVLGKLYFRYADLGVDFLSFEGSVIHAPKGTAGLLVAKRSLLPAPIALMAGIDVGGLCSLAAALKRNEEMFDHTCLETARLRDKFEREVKRSIPEAHILFQDVERLPNCSCIAFPGTISDALLYLLHTKGVYASVGGGRSQRLSHVLLNSGIEAHLAHAALSFALSFDTTEQEIDAAIEILMSCVDTLKTCSRKVRER